MPTVILDSLGDFGLLVRACKLYKERQRGKTEKSLRQALEAKLYLASPPAGAVAVSSVSVAVAVAICLQYYIFIGVKLRAPVHDSGNDNDMNNINS